MQYRLIQSSFTTSRFNKCYKLNVSCDAALQKTIVHYSAQFSSLFSLVLCVCVCVCVCVRERVFVSTTSIFKGVNCGFIVQV